MAGSPELAARVRTLLSGAGIPPAEEHDRGLDHGVFVPFKLIYPAADVPMVQLSLNRNRDAATHLAVGRALAPLRDEQVLIVGSGMSYHNLREFFVDRPDVNRSAEDFDRWLNDAVDGAGREPSARRSSRTGAMRPARACRIQRRNTCCRSWSPRVPAASIRAAAPTMIT